jgi:hypothetical protein
MRLVILRCLRTDYAIGIAKSQPRAGTCRRNDLHPQCEQTEYEAELNPTTQYLPSLARPTLASFLAGCYPKKPRLRVDDVAFAFCEFILTLAFFVSGIG